MCREQRCQDTCVKVLNDSPGQGWGQDFIQEVSQKRVRDCKKNLTLNPKDCREECLPISLPVSSPMQALRHPGLLKMSQEAVDAVPQPSRNL